MKEYRLTWSASSNISFHGETDWMEWGGDPDDTEDQVMEELNRGGPISEGLEQALQESGFEWDIEVRDAEETA